MNPNYYVNWDDHGDHEYKIKEIKKLLKENIIEEQPDFYSDDDKYYAGINYHLGRVKYFINNPDKINAIGIETKVFPNGFLSIVPEIYDGNHRFIAACILNWETILANCGGLIRTIDYLTGKGKTMPIDI